MPLGKQVFLLYQDYTGDIMPDEKYDDKYSDFEVNEDDIENNDEKGKKRIKLVLIFIIVFIILFLGMHFGMELYNRYMIEKPVEATSEATTSGSISNTAVENPVDFDSLIEGNSDIYAYIKIDDTTVDYPIVQSPSDDSFYLKHRAEDKSWSASGAVYTELCNKKSFRDPVTLIYGHNGYGDTFFTTLHKFEDSEFFNEHPYFYIYTPDRRLTYQVISAFKYDDRHIMNSFTFTDGNEVLKFQEIIANPNSALKNVRTDLDTTLDVNSKIVVLSTCITNQKSSRYLVCGVLVKDEKTY